MTRPRKGTKAAPAKAQRKRSERSQATAPLIPQTIHVELTRKEITHLRVALLARMDRMAQRGELMDDRLGRFVPFKEHPAYVSCRQLMQKLWDVRRECWPNGAAT